MHIGSRIKDVMAEKQISATQLAARIHCGRTHIYKIQAKEDLDTCLLMRLSVALEYDFFKDLSTELSAISSQSQ